MNAWKSKIIKILIGITSFATYASEKVSRYASCDLATLAITLVQRESGGRQQIAIVVGNVNIPAL